VGRAPLPANSIHEAESRPVNFVARSPTAAETAARKRRKNQRPA